MIFRRLLALLLLLTISLPGQVTAEEEYWEYTFRPGDSIWKVAEKPDTGFDVETTAGACCCDCSQW